MANILIIKPLASYDFKSYDDATVPQTGSLLYRRLVTCWPSELSHAFSNATVLPKPGWSLRGGYPSNRTAVCLV